MSNTIGRWYHNDIVFVTTYLSLRYIHTYHTSSLPTFQILHNGFALCTPGLHFAHRVCTLHTGFALCTPGLHFAHRPGLHFAHRPGLHPKIHTTCHRTGDLAWQPTCISGHVSLPLSFFRILLAFGLAHRIIVTGGEQLEAPNQNSLCN